MSSRLYREAIASAMHDALASHEHTLIVGQGVTDFKGIFGTTLHLQEEFGDRLIETPLSEDGVAGLCMGAALNGMYPINTHIRADFGLLIFNQVVNLAAKYKYMFGGLFSVPMMFRMVIGRSWGQGAQHSQSLQSLLAHIPGLVVLMPTTPDSILKSYKYAIAHHDGPVVMLEHRLMYELEFDEDYEYALSHPFGSRIARVGSEVTIVATSVMVLEARRAAEYLSGIGIEIEIIDLHCVSNPDVELILASVRKTGKLIVADTSWAPYGVCAEIIRIVCENDPSILKAPTKSLSMAPSPCPTAKVLEDFFYPDVHDICSVVFDLVGKPEGHQLPEKQSMTDFYKHFKGPF